MTDFLLDLQPGLSVVLADTVGANVTRYVHGPRGIHAQEDTSGNWEWMAQDALGSVRSVIDDTLGVLWTGHPDPYGNYFGETGTRQSPYLFTGEYTDAVTDLVHLRARDYAPGLGVFPSLDPFEGMAYRPMSLNGYSWVEGNPVMMTDPYGECPDNPAWYDVVGIRCRYLARRLASRHNVDVNDLYQLQYHELEALTGLETLANVSGDLGQSADNATILPRLFRENPQIALQALQQFGCQNSNTPLGLLSMGTTYIARPFFGSPPSGSPGTPWWLWPVVGGVALGIGAILTYEAITQPGTDIVEARRSPGELQNRTATIAEHLAKLLGRPVAGYSPSGPNPYRDPDRGWCNTIKEAIAAIDRMSYTPDQFNNHFNQTKFKNELDTLKRALREARRWCDDYWGDDFTGGFLAS